MLESPKPKSLSTIVKQKQVSQQRGHNFYKGDIIKGVAFMELR